MSKSKIVITVEGGCILNVLTNDPELAKNIEFQFVDYDSESEDDPEITQKDGSKATAQISTPAEIAYLDDTVFWTEMEQHTKPSKP